MKILYFLFALVSFSSFASYPETVATAGQNGGDAVWMVVTKANSWNLDPGIYSRGKERDWKRPLVLGTVLGDSEHSGIFKFPLTDFTSSYEALAIIDGFICAFNINSNPKNKKSYFKIGGDAIPLVDKSKLQKRLIYLPQIRNLKDFSYFTPTPISHKEHFVLQDILISLRNEKNFSTDNSGITFLLQIEANTEESGDISLFAEPLILDYSYHSSIELRNFEHKDGYVYPLKLGNILAISSKDNILTKVWKHTLAREYQNGKLDRLPEYNSTTDKMFFLSEPKINFTRQIQNQIYKIEVSEPVDEHDGFLKFEHNGIKSNLKGALNYLGEDQFDPEFISEEQLSARSIFQINERGQGIFYQNRKPYFLIPRAEDIETILLPGDLLDDEIPDDVTFFATPYKLQDRKYVIYLSLKSKTKAETYCYLLNYAAKKSFIESWFKISDVYYPKEILALRHCGEGCFFDHLSGVELTKIQWKERHSLKNLHVDIAKSFATRGLEFSYPQEIETIHLSSTLQYKIFASKNSPNKATGIYQGSEQIRNGQLLDSDSELLGRKKFLINSKHYVAEALCLDPNFQNGENGFIIVFLITDLTYGNMQISLEIKVDQAKYNDFLSGGLYSANVEENKYEIITIIFALGDKQVDLYKYQLDIDEDALKKDKIFREKFYEQKFPLKRGEFSSLMQNYKQIVGTNKGKATLIDGQILPIEFATYSNKPLQVSEKNLQSEINIEKIGRVSLNFSFIDTMLSSGELGYDFVLEGSKSSGNKECRFALRNKSFKKISGLSLFINDNEKGKEGHIIAIIHEEDSHNIYHIRVTDSGTENFTNITTLFSIYDENASKENFLANLLIDNEKNLYFPIDLQADPYSRSYKLRCLTTGLDFHPNLTKIELNSYSKNINEYTEPEASWFINPHTNSAKTVSNDFFSNFSLEKIDNFRELIFSDLESQLENLADNNKPSQHQILIVEDELKNYVLSAIAGKWLLEETKDYRKFWGRHNRNLNFYYFNTSNSFIGKNEIIDNFAHMNRFSKEGRRSFLLVNLAKLNGLNLAQERDSFTVTIPYDDYSGLTYENFISKTNIEKKMIRVPPSLIYILAAEGNSIDLFDLQKKSDPTISILLVGTRSEWENIRKNISSYEIAAGTIRNFVLKELNIPSKEQRRKILESAISTKEHIVGGVYYDGSKILKDFANKSQLEVKAKVLDYAVARANALATQNNQNVFTSFVNFSNTLKSTLSADKKRDDAKPMRIDKDFIENIISEIYHLPLNLRSLPKTDPLNILNQKDVLEKWSTCGYHGNLQTKLKVIQGILAQTNSGEQKTIPASFVLFGQKGSGKTFLFETLVKMLDLKEYNFLSESSQNRGASVFKVNLASVVLEKSNDYSALTITSVLEHFENFIKSPSGRRGFIFFDDVHLSSSEVREIFFAKIRSLFEAKDGIYKEISVRNLTIFLSFNPTSDQDKIRKISGHSPPSPLQLAVATFTGSDNKIDESFFNRFGQILEMDYFMGSAKGSELANKIALSAKSLFISDNIFFTTTSNILNRVTESYAKLNARDFLSQAIRGLTQLVKDQNQNEGSYIVIEKKANKSSGNLDPFAFVMQNFHLLPIASDAYGFAHFLALAVNNLRLYAYSDLIDLLHARSEISVKFDKKTMSSILEGMKYHLQKNPVLELEYISLRSDFLKKNLGISGAEVGMALHEIGQKPDLSLNLSAGNSMLSENYAYLSGAISEITHQHSRRDILLQKRKALTKSMDKYLRAFLFIEDDQQISPSILKNWEIKPQHFALEDNLQEVAEGLFAFLREISLERKYIENIESDKFLCPTPYESARIYFTLLDRAICDLAWDKAINFIIKALDNFTTELGLATLPEVQNWLFEPKRSLLRPVYLEYLIEKISAVSDSPWDETTVQSHASRLNQRLNAMFIERNEQ